MSYATTKAVAPSTTLATTTTEIKTTTKKSDESVYERVVRTNKIRCGYIVWEPYLKKDLNGDGSYSGMMYDIMTAIGEELGLEIEWAEETGWGTVTEGIRSGRYDMACFTMWPDAGKFKNMMLTRPLFYSEIYPWVRSDDSRFDNKAESLNKSDVRVAAIEGAFTYKLAESLYPNAQIVGLPPTAQSAEYYMTVATGKADVLNIDRDEINPFLKNNPGVLKQVEGMDPLRIYPHVMGLPVGEPQMKSMIDGALSLLNDNGFFEKIKKRYDTHHRLPAKGSL